MSNEASNQSVQAANLAAVTNVIAVVSETVGRVAGNAIANTVNGETVSSKFLEQAVAARAQSAINTKSGS